MHQNSLLLFDKYAAEHFIPETRVLEIGPDAYPSSYRKRLGGGVDMITVGGKKDV